MKPNIPTGVLQAHLNGHPTDPPVTRHGDCQYHVTTPTKTYIYIVKHGEIAYCGSFPTAAIQRAKRYQMRYNHIDSTPPLEPSATALEHKRPVQLKLL